MIVKRKNLMLISVLISLAILIAIIFMAYSKNNKPLNAVCVPTEEIAIEIGEVICRNAYPEIDYISCEWQCIYDDKNEIWIVFCHKENEMGGKPEIHIRKDNAQVTFISLMA